MRQIIVIKKGRRYIVNVPWDSGDGGSGLTPGTYPVVSGSLVLWIDGSTLSGINGTSITKWESNIANLAYFSQSSTTNAPILDNNSFGGGNHSAKYDAINSQSLYSVNLPDKTLNPTDSQQACTIAIVYRPVSGSFYLLHDSVNGTIFKQHENNTIETSESGIQYYSYPFSSSMSQSRVVWGVAYPQIGNPLSYYENKYFRGTGKRIGTLNPGQPLYLGSYSDPWMSGSVAEVCIWSGSILTQTDIELLMDYYFYPKYPGLYRGEIYATASTENGDWETMINSWENIPNNWES